MYVYPALYENFLSSLVMNTNEYLKRKYFKYEFYLMSSLHINQINLKIFHTFLFESIALLLVLFMSRRCYCMSQKVDFL